MDPSSYARVHPSATTTAHTHAQTQSILAKAQAILINANNIDGYVTACQVSPINAAARRLCEYIAWNDQTVAEKLNERYANSESGAHFIITGPSTEGGMPHTRPPNVICLPAYWPQERLQETIRHELIHINQRKDPKGWKERLATNGWIPVDIGALPPRWVARCRLNPDTFHAPFWAWQGRHVPMPLFEREDKPKLRDISVRWWDMEEERLNNQPPTSFTQTYGPLDASSAEHPYELHAYHPSHN